MFSVPPRQGERNEGLRAAGCGSGNTRPDYRAGTAGGDTVIRGHRVGTQPPPSRRLPDASQGVVGPSLPDAACAGSSRARVGAVEHGPLWDWSVYGETTRERAERIELAMAICRDCPELSACLRARREAPELGPGVWGGQVFTPSDGRTCKCGQPLPLGAGQHQVWCSQQCRWRTKQKAKAKKARHATCVCGTEFSTVQPHQRFCTKQCRRRSERRTSRQRQEAVV